MYTLTCIYTAGFEVGDKEIGRKYVPGRIYTHVPDLHVCRYCPGGRTKGVNDEPIFIFINKLYPSSELT